MNNVCICVGKRANFPFTPKFSDFSLYSIEELCYYFIERTYVIQEDIVCPELVNWIKEECGLKDLAQKLEYDVRKKVSPSIIVTTILEYVGTYSEETIKKVERILHEQASLQPFERWKRRAEYYYKMGRFRQAFDIYFYLLNSLSVEEEDKKASIYYNIASIFALDFDYEKACEFYEMSFGLVPLQQTRVAFLLAKKMQLNDYNYGIYMRENPQWEEEFKIVNEKLVNAESKWENSHTKEMYLQVVKDKEKEKELIRNLKKDYRRQTYLNR